MTGFSTGLVDSHQDIGLNPALFGRFFGLSRIGWFFVRTVVGFFRRIGRVFVRIGLRFFPGLDRSLRIWTIGLSAGSTAFYRTWIGYSQIGDLS